MNDIENIIQQAVSACEMGLYGIERSDSGLVVYIENKDNNVSIKDCETVMKQITYSTDTDHIDIEVSSKGVYPPLFNSEHYHSAIEKWVKIKTNDKTFKGKLVRIEDNVLYLEKGEHHFDIPFSDIRTARLIPTPKGE